MLGQGQRQGYESRIVRLIVLSIHDYTYIFVDMLICSLGGLETGPNLHSA